MPPISAAQASSATAHHPAVANQNAMVLLHDVVGVILASKLEKHHNKLVPFGTSQILRA
jgi:hypothetical protein